MPSSFTIFNASAGSGKTFTLVKEYLKLVLASENPFKFKEILAVTFTNKAANEMKERVLKTLHSISKNEPQDMATYLKEELGLPNETLVSRAQKALDTILRNYSGFSVSTIDSFTHQLIRSFAFDLKISMDFEVEMDVANFLQQSVSQVVEQIGSDDFLTKMLTEFSLMQLAQNKLWDIERNLQEFSNFLSQENFSSKLISLTKVKTEDFENLRKKLYAEKKQLENELKKIGDDALQLIHNQGLLEEQFLYKGEIVKHFKKCSQVESKNYEAIKFGVRIEKNVENEYFVNKTQPDIIKSKIDDLAPSLSKSFYESKKIYRLYVLNHFFVQSIFPTSILRYIVEANEWQKEKLNKIPIYEFNHLINKVIKDEPAPFIYERIGERYRYFFIDEMQDTSILQWQNLIPLLKNAVQSENLLGETGSVTLVGDSKQSIYRWRGGNPEQFINLSNPEATYNPFLVSQKLEFLSKNFRSHHQIVNFNNEFFSHVKNHISDDYYKEAYENCTQEVNSLEGGHVSISFTEKQFFQTQVLEKVKLLCNHYSKNEICILVRSKAEGVLIANELIENEIDVLSSETLLLKQHKEINFIIHLMELILYPDNQEVKIQILYFLATRFQSDKEKHSFFTQHIQLKESSFFEALEKEGYTFYLDQYSKLSLYESTEYIVDCFRLNEDSNLFIQNFLDVVFDFQQKKNATVVTFLSYWEQRKGALSATTTATKDAVMISTIHKSKGLEFPVIIFPCDLKLQELKREYSWYNSEDIAPIDALLFRCKKNLEDASEQGAALIQQKKAEMEFDNINLLYVALTRAQEQLHIVTETEKKSRRNKNEMESFSDLYRSLLHNSADWKEEDQTFTRGAFKRYTTQNETGEESETLTKFISNNEIQQKLVIKKETDTVWQEENQSIMYGNLVHRLLAKVITESDIETVLENELDTGTISLEESEILRQKLYKIVRDKSLSEYFKTGISVFCEQEIITEGQERVIPDRLIFFDKKVVIIDYKTGAPHTSHQKQVNTYATVLKTMNYTIARKLLVYISETPNIVNCE